MSVTKKRTRGKHLNFAKRIKPLVEYFKNCEDKTIGIGDIKQMDENGYLISELRREYKQGKLFPEEIELLEYIGMKWGYTFTDSLELLKLWCAKNKCTLKEANQYSKLQINIDSKIIEHDIGALIGRFRMAKRNGELSEMQVQILDIMGLIWKPRKVNILYKHLIAYAEEVGTLENIPKNMMYEFDGETRNIWRQAERLRKKYIDGTLKQDIVDFFEKYNLWYNLGQYIDNSLTK